MSTPVHARRLDELLPELDVDPATGLAVAEARTRLERGGANELAVRDTKPWWAIVLDQFKGVIVALLVVAAIIALLLGELVEALAVIVVLLVNGAIGAVTEWRAVRSMDALRKLAVTRTRVLRGGAGTVVDARELVPGDIMVLEAGDLVTADARLLEAANLEVDESALTGESLPVAKAPGASDAATVLAERSGMLFRGTAVNRGTGKAVVVATGMGTELGRIAELVEAAAPKTAPLDRQLTRLSHQLAGLTLVVAGLIAGLGALAGRDAVTMLETGVALAVAAIPEGLPIVATLALARGMARMARRNVLIERLAAVETLGATTLVCTDKTGTLTLNRMTVATLVLDEERCEPPLPHSDLVGRLWARAALCTNASLGADGRDEPIGDPLEVALLRAARDAGIEAARLRQEVPRESEVPFDSRSKMMATRHHDEHGAFWAVKGAPEVLLDRAVEVAGAAGDAPFEETARERWRRANDALADEGLRVLAIGESRGERPYDDLVLLALVGLVDPPREGVDAAIADCAAAGVRVVMLTGDQARTASSIGREVGLEADNAVEGHELVDLEALPPERRARLLAADIFARISPEQKLTLVDLYKDAGEIVAMTGDGVNDAPALKQADIGIAMGRRGTQVAREAADMVLGDDSFPSIVAAMREGRVVFQNIRTFVVYLLACNLSEILVIGTAALTGLPLPLLPLQILFLNLVTDVFPALALGANAAAPDVMRRPPRDPKEPILTRRGWVRIAVLAAAVTTATLCAFQLVRAEAVAGDPVTVAFLTLAFAQLWLALAMRDRGSPLWRNEVTRNPWVWAALALCTALLLAAVHLPGLADVLRLVPPDGSTWLLVALASALPLAVGQGLGGVLRDEPRIAPASGLRRLTG